MSFSSIFSVANAGLITDTNNDSFIDDTTGIEWMDFGINNHLIHGDVVAQLDVGGEYFGWALPTEEQVKRMWLNAFANLGAEIYLVDALDGEFRFQDGANEQGSVFTDVMNAMSYNNLLIEDDYEKMNSYGRYIGASGLMSRVTMYSFTDEPSIYGRHDTARFENRPTSDYLHVKKSNSTLLIKVSSAVKVAEPSTLAIFALGIMGLVTRRFKLQA